LICPSCRYENPDSARFCGECGAGLDVPAACPDCGTENERGQKFCNGCGRRLVDEASPAPAARPESSPGAYAPPHLAEKIAAQGRALEGERKQVTVLFADVQGSMDLAESVDSETWRSVMDRFLALVCDGVYRYEGTVNKFTGDGAMALFGAPIAHEDHGRRACYAALHLRDALTEYAREVRRDHGLSFSVRMGLNSGEVVIGTVGDDLHMDYTALGHTVGLAARMEALAEPGKPYLTKHTAALVEGYFELEDVGDLRVKGVHEPVQTYALAGVGAARTRLDAAAARGLSRFVGRETELTALETALERVEDAGQVVAVVAEAGLGKSRLCREFAERCQARGMTVTVGTGVAHGRSVPLLPVLEMLRDYFGIADGDDPRSAREKIAGRLLLIDDSFRDALPVLFDFMGVPDPDNLPPAQMTPEARQRALFAMLARLVHAGTGDGPTLIVVEDLHWLDPGSEAFLRNLIDSLPGAQTLVVVNFRPEYRGDWMQKSYVQQLPLVPLGAAEVGELVSELIGTDPSVDGLPELIAERTGGNPFFIEEVVRALVENGSLVGAEGGYRLAHSIGTIEIPATVQSLLAARIDRLPEREKAVLQAAAVIGNEFSEPVLRRVTELEEHELAESLAALSAAELVYERAVYPIAEFAFKHPLTEEVAYRSQLGRRRCVTHAAAARAIEEVYSERLDEMAAVISGHLERANDPLAAARWGARAAGWAGQSHPNDALRHWRRVRALVRDHHADSGAAGLALGACIWILQYGWRLGISDDEVEQVLLEARELATGNTWALGAVNGAHGIARGMVGNVTEALVGARAAERLADEAGDLELRMSVGTAYWLSLAGQPKEALEKLELSLEEAGADYQLGRQILGFSAVIWATLFSGFILADIGRFADARAAFEEAERLAVEHDDPESLGWVHGNQGTLATLVGEPGDSLRHTREAVKIAERLGSSFQRATAYWGLAQAYSARGDWPEMLIAAETSRRIVRENRTGLQYEAGQLALISKARLEQGDLDGALEAAAEGARIAVAQGTRPQEVLCRIALGRALAGDRPSEARAELEQARELAEEMGLALLPQVHESLADLAGLHGRAEAEARQLELARQGYESQGAIGHLRRVTERVAALTA
jgi:class 3 adenylate cyclase/tetratricopeptide (TPR) repeat protein